MGTCLNCGKETIKFRNYCNWDCHIELAKKNGGRVHTPNNLPIRCITGGSLMLEVEHGDHPDYKFPVEVVYIGDRRDFDDEDESGNKIPCSANALDLQTHETHALIYSDGSIAVTIYECTYSMWYVESGVKSGLPKNWKLTDESLEKIRAHCEPNNGGRNA